MRIVVRGLAPEQSVTVRTSLRDEKGALFRAHARHCADAGGELDLTHAPELGGSFGGLEPMGLLGALEPEKTFWRFFKRDVQTPFTVERELLYDLEPETRQLLAQAMHSPTFSYLVDGGSRSARAACAPRSSCRQVGLCCWRCGIVCCGPPVVTGTTSGEMGSGHRQRS